MRFAMKHIAKSTEIVCDFITKSTEIVCDLITKSAEIVCDLYSEICETYITKSTEFNRNSMRFAVKHISHNLQT